MNQGKTTAALLVTPVLPLPGGSGRALRAWDWLCSLAEEHSVHVLVTEAPGTAVAADYPARAVYFLADALRPAPRWARALGLLCPPLALLSRRFVLDWLHPAPDSQILDKIPQQIESPVQRIVVFRLMLHEVAKPFWQNWPSARRELDMDDLESATRLSVAAALARMGRGYEALRAALIALQYRLLEKYWRTGYHTLWLASPEDAAAMRTLLAQEQRCRPNRFPSPAERLHAPTVRSAKLQLLFVGSLDYPPNEEAARWLCKLAPQLDRRLGDWQLTIVGRRAPAALRRRLATQARIQVLDHVDDLAASYHRADIVLVPLRAGGGTKLKTLEALAFGKPLVATEQGVRGLGLRPGEHYLPAKNSQGFVEAITRLAAEPLLAESLGRAGHRHWLAGENVR